MLNKLKKLTRKVRFKTAVLLANNFTVAKVYRRYYDMKIGSDVRFTGRKISFGSEPYLVEIGNDVTITADVKFETHDGGVSLFRKEYPGINLFGKIKVGSFVFIGNSAIIMPGVTIGDNVIIGAGAIVTKDIPENSIAVGSPARVIKTIDEYKEKALKNAIYVFERDPNKRKQEILKKINQL